MAEQTKTYSTLELSWQPCWEAQDKANELILVVSPKGEDHWQWQAFDFAGDWVAGDYIEFPTALDAQAAAVTWWREQAGRT